MNPGMLRWLILLGLFAFPFMVQAADDSPDIHLNTTAQPETTIEGEMVWGWADLHAHQFANLGFGSNLVVGSPSGAPGSALRDNYGFGAPHGIDDQCIISIQGPLLHPPWWGPICLLKLSGDPIGDILRTGDPQATHDRRGYPSFAGWPAWNTFDHQTMYYKWLQRAFLGGQKLMVMLAVNNELLCEVHSEVNNRSANCKDMPAVNQQLAAIRNMESYVDRQDDGLLNGSGWYKVATGSEQARDIINGGAMAVVMGIEVDTLFNCSKGSTCTEQQINTKLDNYRNLGVRHVFPMHVFDNGFGGAAVYDDSMFNLGNNILTGSYFKVQECTEGNDFKLKTIPFNLRFLAKVLLGGQFLSQPSYPPLSSHCNQRGLTAAGSHLLNGLMERGMLIDVDHMSNLMFDEVLQVAIDNDYPLVASHSTPLGITKAGKKAEGRRTDAQLKAIHDLGGMVALNLSSKPRSALKQYDASIPFTCSFSAQGWVQSYLYTTDLMQGNDLLASVGMGTDFNGFVTAPAPRFGAQRCGSTAPAGSVGSQVLYPFDAHGKAGTFDQQQSANRTFNINQDGLAHVGLLPDFIEELKVLGVSEARLEPLFRSAEKYLQMWEKAESIAFPEAAEPEPPAQVLISTSQEPVANGWIDGDLDITLELEESQEGTSIFYEVSGATSLALTESVSPAIITLSNSGETVLNYYSYNSVSDVQSETSTVLFKIDNTPPEVGVSSVAGNDNGWHMQDVEVFLDAIDLESGVSFIHYRVNGGDWLNVADASFVLTIGTEGTTVIEAIAEDFTGKRSEPVELVINLDKTEPELSCSSAPDRLWPPNNKMVEILNTVVFTDSGSGQGDDVLLFSLSTDKEPEAGASEKSAKKQSEKSSKRASLVAEWDLESFDVAGQLRAEKSEFKKADRLYTMTYIGEDLAGNTASCMATVLVPHSNSSKNSLKKSEEKR